MKNQAEKVKIVLSVLKKIKQSAEKNMYWSQGGLPERELVREVLLEEVVWKSFQKKTLGC